MRLRRIMIFFYGISGDAYLDEVFLQVEVARVVGNVLRNLVQVPAGADDPTSLVGAATGRRAAGCGTRSLRTWEEKPEQQLDQ